MDIRDHGGSFGGGGKYKKGQYVFFEELGYTEPLTFKKFGVTRGLTAMQIGDFLYNPQTKKLIVVWVQLSNVIYSYIDLYDTTNTNNLTTAIAGDYTTDSSGVYSKIFELPNSRVWFGKENGKQWKIYTSNDLKTIASGNDSTSISSMEVVNGTSLVQVGGGNAVVVSLSTYEKNVITGIIVGNNTIMSMFINAFGEITIVERSSSNCITSLWRLNNDGKSVSIISSKAYTDSTVSNLLQTVDFKIAQEVNGSIFAKCGNNVVKIVKGEFVQQFTLNSDINNILRIDVENNIILIHYKTSKNYNKTIFFDTVSEVFLKTVNSTEMFKNQKISDTETLFVDTNVSSSTRYIETSISGIALP